MGSSVEVNRVIRFLYPRHNCPGMASKLEPRRVKVEKVRDLTQQPLDPLTLATAPALNRSRFLVTGTDLDKLAERSFYLDSMQLLPEPSKRFTVVDGDNETIFTTDSQAALAAFVEAWESQE